MTLALNKTTLKQQRDQLKTFQRFLPSLDLKRQQLLAALKQARTEQAEIHTQYDKFQSRVEQIYPLMGSSTAATRDYASLVRIRDVKIGQQNMLGRRQVADRRVALLDVAARRIAQRVNLFEKVLIPRADASIRKIVIFLSDQERAAVVRSKIAKRKSANKESR